MPNLLVAYVFHIFNERVKYFIDNCMFYDENVDFILISNDRNNKFVVPDWVKVLFRDNVGYDFGGWSDAILTDNLYQKYDNFIFVNSSVIGPFIPPYCKMRWTDIYVNGLQGNIKLFGSTINTCGDPLRFAHVQSYIFSMDKHTLQYLINCGIFSITKYTQSMEETVYQKEILMSRKIIENNWNIGSLLLCYTNVDFTFKTPTRHDVTMLGDIMCSQCRNVLWNEYEIVFIKGNRINHLFPSKTQPNIK